MPQSKPPTIGGTGGKEAPRLVRTDSSSPYRGEFAVMTLEQLLRYDKVFGEGEATEDKTMAFHDVGVEKATETYLVKLRQKYPNAHCLKLYEPQDQLQDFPASCVVTQPDGQRRLRLFDHREEGRLIPTRGNLLSVLAEHNPELLIPAAVFPFITAGKDATPAGKRGEEVGNVYLRISNRYDRLLNFGISPNSVEGRILAILLYGEASRITLARKTSELMEAASHFTELSDSQEETISRFIGTILPARVAQGDQFAELMQKCGHTITGMAQLEGIDPAKVKLLRDLALVRKDAITTSAGGKEAIQPLAAAVARGDWTKAHELRDFLREHVEGIFPMYEEGEGTIRRSPTLSGRVADLSGRRTFAARVGRTLEPESVPAEYHTALKPVMQRRLGSSRVYDDQEADPNQLNAAKEVLRQYCKENKYNPKGEKCWFFKDGHGRKISLISLGDSSKLSPKDMREIAETLHESERIIQATMVPAGFPYVTVPITYAMYPEDEGEGTWMSGGDNIMLPDGRSQIVLHTIPSRREITQHRPESKERAMWLDVEVGARMLHELGHAHMLEGMRAKGSMRQDRLPNHVYTLLDEGIASFTEFFRLCTAGLSVDGSDVVYRVLPHSVYADPLMFYLSHSVNYRFGVTLPKDVLMQRGYSAKYENLLRGIQGGTLDVFDPEFIEDLNFRKQARTRPDGAITNFGSQDANILMTYPIGAAISFAITSLASEDPGYIPIHWISKAMAKAQAAYDNPANKGRVRLWPIIEETMPALKGRRAEVNAHVNELLRGATAFMAGNMGWGNPEAYLDQYIAAYASLDGLGEDALRQKLEQSDQSSPFLHLAEYRERTRAATMAQIVKWQKENYLISR